MLDFITPAAWGFLGVMFASTATIIGTVIKTSNTAKFHVVQELKPIENHLAALNGRVGKLEIAKVDGRDCGRYQQAVRSDLAGLAERVARIER